MTDVVEVGHSEWVVIVEMGIPETIEIPSPTLDLVEIAEQGQAGPPGSGEESMQYARRVDFVGDTVIYRGEADPGSSESSAVWRIRRITFVGEDVVEEWAGGEDTFDKVWTSRLALSYN